MKAPDIYAKELELVGGKTSSGHPRYLLHWSGDVLSLKGQREQKFDTPCDCWVLLHWVDNNMDLPESGGGYAELQQFRDKKVPALLDSEALNVRVVVMMAAMAERTRNQFLSMRKKILERRKEREDKETTDRLAAYLEDRIPVYRDAVSYNGQRTTQSVVQQKMEQIEKNLSRTDRMVARMGRGPLIYKPQ